MARVTRGPKKPKTLTEELATLLEKTFVPDLAKRAGQPQVEAALKSRYDGEKARSRTAESFGEWVEHTVEQVGAAWILSCVFARTLEDRGYAERRRLAGEGALDSQQQFFEIAPSLTERDYVLTVFRELAAYPGIADVLGHVHNPAWRLSPSNDSVRTLLGLLRESEGDGLRFRFEGSDTRFLGDLYQDISEGVRDRFALLQTPDFVERFILDQTLEPAIAEFGLEQVRVIDPTCGSGHFLLGAFHRLFERRLQAQPGIDRRKHASQALAQVYGVDLNPYAVAIARFRLTLAYFEHAGIDKLNQAPRVATNLLVADSLLHGGSNRRLSEVATDKAAWGDRRFELDDEVAATHVLVQRYHAVVGNPPYITCRDAALRELYRDRYESASGKYALAAPFTEWFFQLAVDGGFVGLINANSFMKREFGKALIEKVLRRLDLTEVIDSSGAYIPGHGTPTVILFGRNRKAVASTVRAVLSKRAEPSTPEDPEMGHVWASLAAHHTEIDFENDYLSVAEVPRDTFNKHPWSLGGGGAAELKEHLEDRCKVRLGTLASAIGFDAIMGEDELFAGSVDWLDRLGVDPAYVRELAEGEDVRDWTLRGNGYVIFRYNQSLLPTLPIGKSTLLYDHFWRFRTNLINRQQFSKNTIEAGLQWYEYRSFYKSKRGTPLSIAFAEVATHNHFALDRGIKVFKQTAPIIKLPASANEDDHLALLAYLNSSTACFWMKQVFMNKGGSGIGRGIQDEAWESRYQFDGTKLKQIPLPPGIDQLVPLAREMLRYIDAMRLATSEPESVEAFHAAVALQEQIDWNVYALFSLVAPVRIEQRLLLAPGSRPFEHLLLENERNEGRVSAWFERNGYERPTKIANVTRELVDLIRRTPELKLIERPEYKHRWTPSDWKNRRAMQEMSQMLDALESALREPNIASLTRTVDSLVTTGQIREDEREALRDHAFATSVPFLSSQRFTDSGVVKHKFWVDLWAAQRRESDGDGALTPPERYTSEDFSSTVFWQLRGKLDVPKERFISYPGCERDEDKSPLIGWAGWNHLERAQALAALFQERKEQDGWEPERLTPILAGLLELVPWVKQWHNEPDPAYDGQQMGDVYEAFVSEKARELRLTQDDLRNWRPLPKQPKTKKPKADSTSGDTVAPKRARRKKAAADDTAE